jgi:TonB family protein
MFPERLGRWTKRALRRVGDTSLVILIFAALTLTCGGGSLPSIRAGGKMSDVTFPPTPQYDVPPKFISGNAPIYPITYALHHMPGVAVVDFVIDEHGATRDIQVVSATYVSFGSHAVIAIRNWRFEPARKNGKPVAAHVQREMYFGYYKARR